MGKIAHLSWLISKIHDLFFSVVCNSISHDLSQKFTFEWENSEFNFKLIWLIDCPRKKIISDHPKENLEHPN